ncbi:MAG TPA: branched-chain amino acid ABC transporter permease [Candidatus Dormibacteraeota bacterium]|nr:branched-chain amino acid ABC transporter permease [Candidatus Dormibacteraeota bacterium]
MRAPFGPVMLGVVGGIVCSVVAAALPPFARFVAGELAVLVIVSLGVNLLLGVAGRLSVASPAFVGIGANAMTIILLHCRVSVLIAVPLAVAVGWAVGWLLGLVTLRLQGFYLAVVTFGFLDIFLEVLYSGGAWTGGGYGLIVPVIILPWIGKLTVNGVVVAAAFTTVVLIVLTQTLQRSRIGRAWIASKNDAAVAELQGIDVRRVRVQAFAVSSAMITLAGCFEALLLGVTNPSAYSLNVAIEHFTYVVIGGLGAGTAGPVAGPLVLFAIPEVFRSIGQYREVFYGTILLLTLVLAPRGISGALEELPLRSRKLLRRGRP